jgi:MurNAc alpha-1-phosphate uridylyltransferase
VTAKAFPKTAMVMAAGYGKRLRPLTDKTPKPMVKVLGRPMIDVVLDRLAAAGVERAVVNLHHLGEVIREHLKDRTDLEILFSEEKEILETGGGTKLALPLLGPDPFFVVNAKIIWLNGREDALHRLARAWDPKRMDSLLLLQPTVTAIGYDGPGDFLMDQDGKLNRRPEWEVAPFLYSGVNITHPRLFDASPEGAFSVNLLWDRAIEQGRLYGIRHDGEWFHVSTPQHLREVERELGFHGIRF